MVTRGYDQICYMISFNSFNGNAYTVLLSALAIISWFHSARTVTIIHQSKIGSNEIIILNRNELLHTNNF